MLKLVIVEDEDIIRQGLVSFNDWEKMGYEVVGEASNGRAGLEVIRRTQPDVVITDIRMPIRDGLDMLRELRDNGFENTVIILSGYEDFAYAKSAMKLGASEYLLKPVEIGQLREVMKKVSGKIAQERKKQEEYRLMKSREEYNRRQSRKYLISQILTESIEDISESILQVLENYYFAVIIISMENFPILSGNYDYLEMLEADLRFEQEISDLIAEDSDVLCVRVDMGERVLCLLNLGKEELQAQTERTAYALQQFRGKEYVSVCVSSINMGARGLKKIYRRARQKQKENYVGLIHDIVKVEDSRKDMFHYMKYDVTNLIVEIKTGDYLSIDRELENLERELRESGKLSHMHLMLVMTNLYSEVIKIPEEVGSTAGEVLKEPMEYYRKIVTDLSPEESIETLRQVCHILNDYFVEISRKRNDHILKDALEYLQKNFGDPYLQIKDVAGAVGVSNSYLSIMMKQGTGKTFVECLTQLRIQKAKRLLSNTELKNYEIAELCGFTNATYFSTVFKSFCGLSPSAYKKQNADSKDI